MQRRKETAASSSMAEGEEGPRANEPLGYRHRAQSVIQSKALDELETEVFETGLYENLDLSRGSRYGVMAAEIIFGEFTSPRCSCNIQ